MTLNQKLNEGRKDREFELYPGRNSLKPNPMIECKNGYQVSIQCQEHSYCEPRKNYLDVTVYSSFELGFPNMSDELLDKYAEDPTNLTETVYPYVPREVVEQLIEKHGGIK